MFTRKTRSTTDSRPQAEPARTRTRSSPLNKQKHSSLSKTFKPKNETISSKQPPKSTNASPHPKVMSKPVTPKKSLPRISGRSPAKNVRKENGSPAKPIQRSHFSRVASKKGNQNTSKPLTPKKCSVKTPPKKTVFQAASIVEKSPSHLRSTRSSAVSTSPSVSKEVVKVTPNRERAKLAVKTSPTKTLSQDTRKVEMSPVKTPSRSLRSPSDLLLSKSPSQSPSARKRLLSPPIQNVKIKKVGDMSQSKTNATISTECIDLCDSSNDSFKEMKSNCKGNKTHVLASSSEQNEPHATDSDPSLDESKLSGRFLRRKWFSLKAHGGFTCLRSAILSPEEVAKVVMQHNMVDTGKMHDVNFFTTKLMMRLSSRLPPVRARPSCEELVDLVNTKPTTTTVECPKESKGEGTAIRVKLEKRSFTDTITHLKNEPPKKVVSPGSPAKNTKLDSKISAVTRQADGTLTKKQERDIALQQLKNLRYL